MKKLIINTVKAILYTGTVLFLTKRFICKYDKKIMDKIKTIHRNKPTIFKLYKRNRKIIKHVTNGFPVFSIAILIYSFGFFRERRELLLIGRDLGIGLTLAAGISRLFKHLSGRARPRVTHDTVFNPICFKKGYDSFPSGHTTVSVCFAVIMSNYFPKFSYIFYFYSTLTAFDRLIGTSHFPSDIISGIIIGRKIGNAIVELGETNQDAYSLNFVIPSSKE